MEFKVIKDETQYQNLLRQAEELVAADPVPGSDAGDKLELLTVLIEDYEKRYFPVGAPDPIDAIEFRMAEQGLRQKDLIPLLGSRSRVSEVLGRKRPLTVQMIRALSTGLGIPLEILVSDTNNRRSTEADTNDIEWQKFPVKEMAKRGWFDSLNSKLGATEEIVKEFLGQLYGSNNSYALYRRTFRGSEISEKSYYSTLAWTARVLIQAKSSKKNINKYDPSKINPNFFKELAQLSWFDQGPLLAGEFLGKYGISLIIEPKLPNALLDGAAMLTESGMPVIGMTLRHDRVDYFWFTLLHEVVHVWKHLNASDEAYIDRVENSESESSTEKEANR